jgi:hypothetical protein
MIERMLLLGMAYPEYSKKYMYSVCMAGITESGELRRIYPIPIEKFYSFGFHKKQWIEYEIREKGDYRKESFKIHSDSLKKTDFVTDTEIRKICQENALSLEELRQNWKTDKSSLGIVKPILSGFTIAPRPDNIKRIGWNTQTNLEKKKVTHIDKLDYNVYYKFHCCPECEKTHKCICLDTEAGQLYRKIVQNESKDNTTIIKEKMKYRLYDWMQKRDLYFLMGTHSLHPTAWMIISLIYPEKAINRDLFSF